MMPQPQTPPAHIGILQLMTGAHVAGAVSCLAQLGIPDLVEAAPKSAEELAKQMGADPQALYRLMRATASIGVLSEGPDGKFSQTPMSTVLRTNATPSLRAFATMGGREWHGRGWSELEYCVRTGKQALDHIYGAHVFDFLKQHPAEGQIVNDATTELSMIDSPAVAEAYDFNGIRSIVDVGGGHGLLLATILKSNPHLRGTLYEMPHVVEGAKEWSAEAGDGALHFCFRRYVFLCSSRCGCLHHEAHHSRLARRSVRTHTQSLSKKREFARQTPRG
jgi:C-methyltransferase